MNAPRSHAVASRAGAGRCHRLPAELVGDRRHRRARHRRREGPGRRRLGRLQRPARGGQQRVLRRQRRVRAASRRSRRPATSTRTTIGRTTFSASNGWLYAVVQDTTNDDLRGQGVFVSQLRQPGRPVDAASPTPTSSPTPARRWVTRPAPTTRASSPTTTRTSSPTRPTASTSTCSSRRSSSRPTAARRGTPSGRTGTSTSPATRTTTTRTTARRRPTPTSTPGMIFDGQFWTGNDGGVWRRPLTWHDRGQLDQPQRDPAHHAELLDRGRQGRQGAGLLGRPAGQR